MPQNVFVLEARKLSLPVLRTADVLRRFFSAVIEPYGITHQQYNVLRILRGARSGGLPTLTIIERMIEQTPGITRLLDRLEAKGLVKRERGTADRRQVFCQITPAGLALLEKLDQPINEADNKALEMLDPTEQAQLIRLLNAIRVGHQR